MQTVASSRLNGIDTAALRTFIDAVDADHRQGVCGFRVTTTWQGGVKTCTRVDDCASPARHTSAAS